MKTKFLTIALASSFYFAPAQDAYVENSDVYTGQSEIVASQQVILKPGFHSVAGCNVRVYIGSRPDIDHTTPTVNLPGGFDTNNNDSYNYIHTTTLREKTTDETSLSSKQRVEIIGYFDGLGRPSQTINIQGSPTYKDIVQPVVYDNFGREDKMYLPYMSTNNDKGDFIDDATAACATYYNTAKDWRPADGTPFKQIDFEESPLNRILGETGVGANWQGKPTSIEYKTNSAAIENWTVSGNLIPATFTPANFDIKQLYVTEYSDEDGRKTREYKDKLGRVVRKEAWDPDISQWLATRYIYDDFGLLRCVVPPLATSPANTGLCYFYSYDKRKRMIEKQVPGALPVYMVYDKRDRLAMVKDAENNWQVTLYDAFNRPVITGEKATGDSRLAIQTQFDNYAGTLYEVWSVSGTLKGYSNQSIPSVYRITASEIKTVTWYDDYGFKSLPGYTSGYGFTVPSPAISGFPASQDPGTKGMVTGTLTYIESTDLSEMNDSELLSAMYYDGYANPIQVISDNHRGGKDVASTLFNFTGQPQVTKLVHNVGSSSVVLVTTYTYDHQGRLLNEKLQHNGGTQITIAANTYSDTGEPIAKYLHGTAGGDKFNQKVDYKYNIKGWLKEINQVASPGNDLFAMALHYEDANNGGSSFNGNIWRMDWKNATGDPKRYEFAYDGLNRLKSAGYADGASFNNHTTNYFDTRYTYDANGNLQTLKRYAQGSHIDDLDYDYYTGSNKLQKVDDLQNNALGYKEGTSSYLYDNNGNMRSDHNATIIGYNFMNLPELVTYNTTNKIKYAYTSTGSKLQKIVKSPTYGDKIVDYIGPFLYEDNDLKCIFTSEGRLVKVNDGGNVLWKYEYNLKDHLGNVRAVFAAHSNGMPELMQQTDYYPFGMVMAQQENFNLEEVKNKYLYNGKELQDDDIGIVLGWYDYGARFYDPALGRWHTMDSLAENYYHASSFGYVENNPIIRIDPDGRDWYQVVDDEGNIVQGGAVMWREGGDAIDGYSNIGTSYTMDLGDGVSMTYNQNTPETMTETVLNVGDWETQRELAYDSKGNVTGSKNKAGDEGNCFYQAGQMVSNSGATSLGGTANNINSTNGQTNYMNAQIGTGNSVRVHVDYNGDGVGDHWVSISSSTTNLTNNSSTYNFYDPGTIQQARGTHATNIFNVTNGNISGITHYSGRTYRVIAVRRNQ